MIRLLIMSNMYPSQAKPYAGLFVKNQFEHLKNSPQLDVNIFYMKRMFTNKLGSLLKYLGAALRFGPNLFRRYDVIHLHFFYPLIFLAYLYCLLHPRTRLIVTFHGSDVRGMFQGRSAYLFRRAAKRIDYVISVGEDLKDDISENLGLKTDKVLPAGVSRHTFYVEPGSAKRYDFIFVGSLYFNKGLDMLIEAIKIVDQTSIRYCFVGTGEYMDELLELSKSYAVEIKESQTQESLRNLYNASRFLLHPSRQEAFGLVVSEAMYCGVPAITSKRGGLKDQIEPGYNGFFIEQLDAKGIAEAILSAVDMSEEAYQRLSDHAKQSNDAFSLDNVCRQLSVIYSSLANSPQSQSKLPV